MLIRRVFSSLGNPPWSHCFLHPSLHENACPALRSRHVQGAAACNITDNIWAIGTPTAWKQPHFPPSPPGARSSASAPALNGAVRSCAGRQRCVTDGNSIGLLRGSTAIHANT